MKELESGELNKILKGKNFSKQELSKHLDSHFEKKAVLGFDIYQYSRFPIVDQSLIPHLFKKLYDATVQNCLESEKFFFTYSSKNDFENSLIDTGDGGFQILNNPFEAFIFAIYFQANIVRYNSGNELLMYLYKPIGEISLRYSLTFQRIFKYANNFYGPAIINCARIIAKDRLNRFLADDNSINWFKDSFNSLETCLDFDPQTDFKKIRLFKSQFNETNYESILFPINGSNKIKSIDILKIGYIKSKYDILSIYSIHSQILLSSNGKPFKKYRISLGNINTGGLDD